MLAPSDSESQLANARPVFCTTRVIPNTLLSFFVPPSPSLDGVSHTCKLAWNVCSRVSLLFIPLTVTYHLDPVSLFPLFVCVSPFPIFLLSTRVYGSHPCNLHCSLPSFQAPPPSLFTLIIHHSLCPSLLPLTVAPPLLSPL